MKQKEELSVTKEAMEQAGSPVGIGEIISRTFDEYTKNFAFYIMLSLIAAAPGFLIGLLPLIAGIGGDVESFEDASGGELVGFFALLGVGILLAIVVNITVVNGMVLSTLKSLRGTKMPEVGEALKMGLKPFWRVIGISIVVGLIVTAGFIMLIIPGFIFSLWYMFTIIHTLDTDEGLSKSMDASRKIGKGNYWTVIGLWAIYVAFTIGISFLALIPIFGQLVGVAITPIVPIAVTMMYLAFKGEKLSAGKK